jgi:hypothetical protein
MVRVSLPVHEAQPRTAVVYRSNDLDKVRAPQGRDVVDLGDGVPAFSGPDFIIPRIEDVIPDINDQTAVFTCNGETLLKMLKIATEVSDDHEKTLRLRVCGDTLRIDTYRQPGAQEFLGILKGVEYNGNYIPGDKTMDVKEEKPKQITTPLKTSTGRRFRS